MQPSVGCPLPMKEHTGMRPDVGALAATEAMVEAIKAGSFF
jgi:hypothetical protein